MSGQDTYGEYLDIEEQALNNVLEAITRLKRLLAKESSEIRDWRLSYRNWKRKITIVDPEELKHQLTQDQQVILRRAVRALNRHILNYDEKLKSNKQDIEWEDEIEHILDRVIDNAETLERVDETNLYGDIAQRIINGANRRIDMLGDWTPLDLTVSYDDFLEQQENEITPVNREANLLKVNMSDLMVEVDENEVESFVSELVEDYLDSREESVESALSGEEIWNVVGQPTWSAIEAMSDDDDESHTRLYGALLSFLTDLLQNWIRTNTQNFSDKRVQALNKKSFERFKGGSLETVEIIKVPQIEQDAVSSTLIEEMDSYVVGSYNSTRGHEDAINELASQIKHGCPTIEKKSMNFDQARDRSGLSDALDQLDNARMLFGSQRHSSTGQRLISQLDGAFEACYSVSDKRTLRNAERRLLNIKTSMLTWWHNNWTQRGGVPDNDNTVRHWKSTGKVKPLY